MRGPGIYIWRAHDATIEEKRTIFVNCGAIHEEHCDEDDTNDDEIKEVGKVKKIAKDGCDQPKKVDFY